jgi:hypothetical protein
MEAPAALPELTDACLNVQDAQRDLEGSWTYEKNGQQFQYTVIARSNGFLFRQMLTDTMEVTATLYREGCWYTGELCQAGRLNGLIRLRLEGATMVSNVRLPCEKSWQEGMVAGRIAAPDLPEVKSAEKPEAPAATATPKVDDRTPWERFEAVVDQVQKRLMDRMGCVANVVVVEGRNGWVVTAYVKPEQLKLQDVSLKELAQQAMITAMDDVLGYNTLLFTSMPLGFSCTLVVMPGSRDKAEVIVRFQPAP